MRLFSELKFLENSEMGYPFMPTLKTWRSSHIGSQIPGNWLIAGGLLADLISYGFMT